MFSLTALLIIVANVYEVSGLQAAKATRSSGALTPDNTPPKANNDDDGGISTSTICIILGLLVGAAGVAMHFREESDVRLVYGLLGVGGFLLLLGLIFALSGETPPKAAEPASVSEAKVPSSSASTMTNSEEEMDMEPAAPPQPQPAAPKATPKAPSYFSRATSWLSSKKGNTADAKK